LRLRNRSDAGKKEREKKEKKKKKKGKKGKREELDPVRLGSEKKSQKGEWHAAANHVGFDAILALFLLPNWGRHPGLERRGRTSLAYTGGRLEERRGQQTTGNT
jgi:hypothetical protein